MKPTWKVALRGTHDADNAVIDGVEFSSAFNLDKADALLSFCGLVPEILEFNGPKAWYTDEPITMNHFRTRLARKALRILRTDEFFHHTNSDPVYRVLSPTHCGELTLHRPDNRLPRAVAAVNNFGGRIWWLRSGASLRNRLILQPQVDLFGAEESWSQFRRWPWSPAKPPANYKGSAKTVWWDDSQVRFLAGYKVVVCLENTFESPHYFSEKFPNAVRAGCIPVYHATPEARAERLAGAKWVDPADFDFDPKATVDHALRQDIVEFQEINDQWLKSPHLAATHRRMIWERVATLMRLKIEHFQVAQNTQP